MKETQTETLVFAMVFDQRKEKYAQRKSKNELSRKSFIEGNNVDEAYISGENPGSDSNMDK
jgi:hypothetical protein